MLKKTLLVSALAAIGCMNISGQNYPKLGVDPIEKVIDAMTLDEKLDMEPRQPWEARQSLFRVLPDS